MAKVKIEEVIDHLSSEVRKALRDAVQAEIPASQFDEHSLFRAFRRAIGRKCSTWEQVPDRFVEKD